MRLIRGSEVEVSTETAESQRSIFQSKSRNELIDIAYAMGGRPSARSRKSELVDLIVGLAGFGTEAESSSGMAESGAAGAGDSAAGDGAGAAGDSAAGDGAAGAGDSAAGDSAVSTRIPPSAVPGAAVAGTAPLAPSVVSPARYGASGDSAGDASDGRAQTKVTAAGGNSDSAADAAGEADGAASGHARPGGSAVDVSAALSTATAHSNAAQSPSTTRSADAKVNGSTAAAAGSPAATVKDAPAEAGSSRTEQERGQRDRRENQAKTDRPRRDEAVEGGNRRNRNRNRNRGREEEPWDGELVDIAGYLDLRDEGYGFLRINAQVPSRADVYVSVKQIRQFGMRKGDHVSGASRPAGRSEKNPALLRLDEINGRKPEESKKRPRFEELTPLFPEERLNLERAGDPANMTTRIVDLLSPIGKGQRGLIVSPPKAGKTTIMKEIARSIETNNPECKLLVLLVDERPEEVTDMRRWLRRGEVAASTFDRPAEEHTTVAELTIERAKRMVEMGDDVVIMLDGITRLARAYNLAAPATGRIMSGGVDSGALYPPKKFFGAARNMEEGGSLTILATALVETGSKMDEVIFEEFKGTGNMELRLDRRAAERRIYPAINVDASSTRHEELLFERRQLQQVWKLRRVLSGLASDHGGNGAAGLELLIDRLKTFPNNAAFLEGVAKGPMGG